MPYPAPKEGLYFLGENKGGEEEEEGEGEEDEEMVEEEEDEVHAEYQPGTASKDFWKLEPKAVSCYGRG